MKLSLTDLENQGAYIERDTKTNTIHIIKGSYSDRVFMDWVKSIGGDNFERAEIVMTNIPSVLLDEIVPRVSRVSNSSSNELFIRCQGFINKYDNCDIVDKIRETVTRKGTYICTLQTKWEGSKKNIVVRQHIIK